jgi:ferric-dicitrate binding protein FerR (iron transport regulator)
MSKVKQIIAAFAGKRHSDELRREFSRWFEAPYEVEEKDTALRELWERQQNVADASTEAAYAQLLKKIETSERRPETGTANRDRLRRGSGPSLASRIARVAAVVAIPLLSLAGAWWLIESRTPQAMEYVECFVPNGTTRTVTLPDSSQVTLNAGSVLIYPRSFAAGTRDVYLNGEAAFRVERDEHRPFTVRTCDLNVKVLGTEFNVSAYSDDAFSSATLLSGSVEVAGNHDGNVILARAGEQFFHDRASGISEKRTVDPASALAWQDGDMIFERSSIHDIIRTIERRYDVEIYLSSGRFDEEEITAKFIHGETLDDFLSVFGDLIPGMRYRVENKNIYLY